MTSEYDQTRMFGASFWGFNSLTRFPPITMMSKGCAGSRVCKSSAPEAASWQSLHHSPGRSGDERISGTPLTSEG